MMVQIYIIFDNNSFLLQDLNIQSNKHELLKRATQNDIGIETHLSESPIVAKANTVVILR